MTYYVCKYAPIEIISGFGDESSLCNASVGHTELADKVVHRNLCSFSRACIETMLATEDSAIVLTDCCDSIRRSCDILREQGKQVFFLQLPRANTPCARKLYRDELLRFIIDYAKFSGKKFFMEKFKSFCEQRIEKPKTPYIALMGARVSDELLIDMQALSPLPLVNNTCTGTRFIGKAPVGVGSEALMDWYAGQLLSQVPCMRMSDVSSRSTLLADPLVSGVVYHTVSFCDFYNFEYAKLTSKVSLPIVKIETDYTVQTSAQLKNRLEAFFEHLKPKNQTKQNFLHRRQEKWYVAGIDSGSTTTNVVILDESRHIVSFSIAPTGVYIDQSAHKTYQEALKKADLSKDHIVRSVSTGYGRTGIGFGDRDITEITCHAKGAYFLDQRVRTVIDIGGQDSKVIKLQPSGEVKDFAMNDKCAAGTGRFLEMMAQSLGITLQQMSAYGLNWEENITISSMCSVFAQSEVVSLIASGKKLPDIVHGLNVSVATKVLALRGRTQTERECMLTGGVAKNIGVVKAVEEKLGYPVLVPQEPEICGALGAALIAWEEYAMQ